MSKKKKNEPKLVIITPDIAGQIFCLIDDIATSLGINSEELIPLDENGNISFSSKKITGYLIKLLTKDFDREQKKVGKTTTAIIDMLADIANVNADELKTQSIFKIVALVVLLMNQFVKQANEGFLEVTGSSIVQDTMSELPYTENSDQTEMLSPDLTLINSD